MKRTELKRKTPLRPKTGLKRGKPLVSRTRLESGSTLRRTRFKQKVPRQRTAAEGGDPEYLAWIRTHPCCRCGACPPSHAHHEILNGRGKSQKAPDARSLPFCFGCHDQFHGVTGRFRGFTKEQRRDYQDIEITRLRAIWRGIQDHGVAQEPEALAI